MLASPFHLGGPIHSGAILEARLARQHRELAMVGIITAIYCCENLYLSKKLAPYIVPALQELAGGRQTEVLPILQNIFLGRLEPSGPVQEGIEKFVGTRQDPIAVNRWEGDQRDGESDEDELSDQDNKIIPVDD